jgi:hypothetical protein
VRVCRSGLLNRFDSRTEANSSQIFFQASRLILLSPLDVANYPGGLDTGQGQLLRADLSIT